MTLQASGAITLNNVNSEIGKVSGSPISLGDTLVRATAEGLYTELSEMLSLTTDPIPVPLTIPTLSPIVPTKSAIKVDWEVYTEPKSVPTGYNVYYGTDPTLTTSTKVVVTGGAVITRTLTGLLANTTYYVKVTVNTAWGESPHNGIVSLKTTLT